MEKTFCYVNGQIVDSQFAMVSVFDHGFTVADGVFETLKLSSGSVFALDRHLDRLEQSCFGLGITCPNRELIRKAVSEVCAKNNSIDYGRLRITVTSGAGPLGSDRLQSQPTLVISVAPQSQWPSTAQLLIMPWARNETSPLVTVKTTSYAENVHALAIAKSFDFSEAIFLNTQGKVTEGTGSNIFFVKDRVIFTPDKTSGLLQGVTRNLVIEWAATKFEIRESSVSEENLFNADEMFITSTTRDVQPVSRLARLDNSHRITKEAVYEIGSVTQEIALLFKSQSQQMSNP